VKMRDSSLGAVHVKTTVLVEDPEMAYAAFNRISEDFNSVLPKYDIR